MKFKTKQTIGVTLSILYLIGIAFALKHVHDKNKAVKVKNINIVQLNK